MAVVSTSISNITLIDNTSDSNVTLLHSTFRPADHGFVSWTQPDRDLPNASSGHGIEEPSEFKSKKNDQKNHNSKALSDLIKAYMGDKMKFSGD
jgi:hypothetical protein